MEQGMRSRTGRRVRVGGALILGSAALLLGSGDGVRAQSNSSSTSLSPAGAARPAPAGPISPGALSGAAARSPTLGASQGPATAAAGPLPPASSEKPPIAEPAPNPTASAAGGAYQFTICNRYSRKASAAIAYRHPSGEGFNVAGWLSVEPGSCETVGNILHGWLYYYADADGGGSWDGTAVRACVVYPGPFNFFIRAGENRNCQGNEVLRGFAGTFISQDVGTYTWNLTP